ncbi:hypothetical protein LHYA1_G005229 [Lachnellula hyalina]|uniref:SWI5-dependent HO expression protein 3 n=1 Tax=Lachnellula hyalina TaxID=1316788 RepID=A0A8H8U0D4_9HELO|nr:uncharacterized protein LHYA1_G005229 [Lachnellula hyalina]TVY25931.1 hypothetical protein LHYA1_G005229 [Lachnellula hyalina]
MDSSDSENADSFVAVIENRLPERGIEGPIDVPVRTLSPASAATLNMGSNPPSDYNRYAERKSPQQSTIRSVNSDYIADEAQRTTQTRPSTTTMPHSTKTLPNLGKISTSTSHPPQTHQTRPNGLSIGNGLTRTISSEFGLTRSYSNNSLHPADDNPASNIDNDTTSPEYVPGTPQWSSAVGKAREGKTGRVIERLMGENDMLKRDLNIERLRAEESRQSVKMAEESKLSLASRYESELHDAAINKTLLKRKERQLADLKAQVNIEKQRADGAVESERSWRDAMDKTEEESKRKVEEAQQYAALMEGRVNTMTTHWKDQNAEVERKITKLSKEIKDLVEVRQNDDRKIHTLQGLCEQQREMLVDLERKKEAIGQAFEDYKQEQEDGLKAIKYKSRDQEERNEAAITETLEALGTLKWAINVNKNVNLDKD